MSKVQQNALFPHIKFKIFLGRAMPQRLRRRGRGYSPPQMLNPTHASELLVLKRFHRNNQN